MRVRVEPQPTPQDAAAIAAALEELFAHPGPAGRELRFNDVALAPLNSIDYGHARGDLSDPMYPRRCTWRDVARIEALTRGV